MRGAHHCSGPPPPRLRNDLYCVEWDVKLYYIILFLTYPTPKNNLSMEFYHCKCNLPDTMDPVLKVAVVTINPIAA